MLDQTTRKGHDWWAWLVAVRAFSFPASVVPVLVAAAMAAHCQSNVTWWLSGPVAVASILIHAATNLVNDYFDYINGVDQDYIHGSSGVLVTGRLQPRQVLAGGVVLFGVVCALGLWFIWLRGWPILLLGVVGLLGGWFYTAAPIGYKYMALGDPLVFLLMGPLMVIGSYFMLSGSYSHNVLVASLPVGCLVAAILNANNLRDIAHDRQARVQTIAALLGPRRGRIEYYGLVAGAYVIVVLGVLLSMHGAWVLVVLASLPLAGRAVWRLHRSDVDEPSSIATLDVQTAQLHLVFGVLWAIGIWLEAVFT